jgi:hypothetical protein
MNRAAVPEATINKDGEPYAGERDVGSDQVSVNADWIVFTEPVAAGVQGSTER